MNKSNLQQLFSNYIARFDHMNNTEHAEWFKWVAAKSFRPAMDKALAANENEFAQLLKEAKKTTSVLIDGSHIQPFAGLVQFAEKGDPAEVQNMFKDLYAEDGGDVHIKQDKIFDFIDRSHRLRDKYYYNSFRFKDDIHSVTGYMFLYDPDHNYLYKYSHAREFAKYTEFGDDWGSGKNTRLDIYYRMCDQLVEYIKQEPALLETNASRYTRGFVSDPQKMHPDTEKHILAFDIIYCGYTYGLYDGIIYVPGKSIKPDPEKRKEAYKLFDKWQHAREDLDLFNERTEYLNSVFQPGIEVHHTTYGNGIIQKSTETQIEVPFDSVGVKKIGILSAATLGRIEALVPGYSEEFNEYQNLLKGENTIKSLLSFAEHNLTPYVLYLDDVKRDIFEESIHS